jgi:hypothetical protein
VAVKVGQSIISDCQFKKKYSLLRRPFPAIAFSLFALVLAGAPTSTKLGGLAWVLLCLMGFWAFLRSERIQQSDTGLQFHGKLATTGPSPVEEAARIWLFACLAATAIRIIPHAFWQDDWDRRHAEMRLVLGAMATVALVKWPPFYRLTGLQKSRVGDALAMACALGMGVTALFGRETPLHAIAWAVSLSFLVCLLAPMVLDPMQSPARRKLWALGVLMGCMGVVLSQ